MIRRQLQQMVDDATALQAVLHPDDNVPAWTQKKIATAQDRLHSASGYLRYKIADYGAPTRGRRLGRGPFAQRRLDRFAARLEGKSPEELEEIAGRLEQRIARLQQLAASGGGRRPGSVQRRLPMVQKLLALVEARLDRDDLGAALPPIGSDPLDAVKPYLPIALGIGLLGLLYAASRPAKPAKKTTRRRRQSRRRRNTRRRSRRNTRR